jgi:hypothetical protein
MKVEQLRRLLAEVPQDADVILIAEDSPSDLTQVQVSQVRPQEIVYLRGEG